MSLDKTREFTVVIDSTRSVGAVPVLGGATVVLTVEDPHSVCVVELTQAELLEIIDELTKLVRMP